MNESNILSWVLGNILFAHAQCLHFHESNSISLHIFMIFFVGLAWRAAHIFTRKDFNAIFSNPPCRSASPLKISPGGIFWVANNERHSSVLSLSFKSFLDFLFMFTGVCEDPMHSSSRYYAAQRGITSVHTMCICIHVSAFVFL